MGVKSPPLDINPVLYAVGKDGRRTVIGPWGYLNRKLPFIELPLRTAGTVPADSSVANTVGTQLRTLINSALARWRMTVLMETIAESGKEGWSPRKYAPDSAWVWRMSRLTLDGTAEPNSRDQTLRRERGQGKCYFPCSADHEQDWQPYQVDAQSAESSNPNSLAVDRRSTS